MQLFDNIVLLGLVSSGPCNSDSMHLKIGQFKNQLIADYL